jgi:hypothetical protein
LTPKIQINRVGFQSNLCELCDLSWGSQTGGVTLAITASFLKFPELISKFLLVLIGKLFIGKSERRVDDKDYPF